MTTFTPYECSLGTVVSHDGGSYVIQRSCGQVEGYPANGEPSAENVEADLANPPAQVTLLSQETYVVLTRLTDAEIDALTGPSSPTIARRAWLMAASTGIISQADPNYTALVGALDQLGVIAANRWPTLLAP